MLFDLFHNILYLFQSENTASPRIGDKHHKQELVASSPHVSDEHHKQELVASSPDDVPQLPLEMATQVAQQMASPVASQKTPQTTSQLTSQKAQQLELQIPPKSASQILPEMTSQIPPKSIKKLSKTVVSPVLLQTENQTAREPTTGHQVQSGIFNQSNDNKNQQSTLSTEQTHITGEKNNNRKQKPTYTQETGTQGHREEIGTLGNKQETGKQHIPVSTHYEINNSFFSAALKNSQFPMQSIYPMDFPTRESTSPFVGGRFTPPPDDLDDSAAMILW